MKKTYVILLMLILIFLFVFNFSNNVLAQKWVLAGQIPNPGYEPSISVIDANNVWIAGGYPDTPKVYRTTNAGLNWIDVQTAGISKELFCIWAVNANTVYVGEGIVTGNAKLFKTTNAGLNWTVVLQTNPNQGYFNNLIFSTANPLVGGAMAEKMYITTNGGVTWVQKNPGGSGITSVQNSMMFIDGNYFGFGMNSGASRVNVSSDGGTTWVTQNINLIGSIVSGFAYKDDKMTGLASTVNSMPNIARTTNGGNTWTTLNVGNNITGKTLIKWLPETNTVYIVGSNGTILKSTNDGLTWNTLSTTGITGITHFSASKINNVVHGYAISSSGSVLKLTDSLLMMTGINKLGFENPTEFKLFQNYPNPFNPTTKIKFQIPENKFVTLKVFNLMGQEVSTPVNGKLTQGTYEVNWNASELPSGVYFYQLSIDNVKHSMMKMILIK